MGGHVDKVSAKGVNMKDQTKLAERFTAFRLSRTFEQKAALMTVAFMIKENNLRRAAAELYRAQKTYGFSDADIVDGVWTGKIGVTSSHRIVPTNSSTLP